jgi:hypothetical protein
LLRQARRAAAATATGGLVALALLGALAAPARATIPDPSPASSSPTALGPDAYPGASTRSAAVSHSVPSSTFVPAAGSVGSVVPAATVERHAPVVRTRVSGRSRPAVTTTHHAAKHETAARKPRATPRKSSSVLPFADLFVPARAAASAAPVLVRAERNAVSAGLALAVAGVVLSSGLLLAGVAREVRR